MLTVRNPMVFEAFSAVTDYFSYRTVLGSWQERSSPDEFD